MLVKFFKRGDSEFARGEDVLDYMLGIEWKHDNQIIREGASVIRGNPYHTTDIINNSLHKKKYLSGCLSFHADEKIDEALQQKLMDDLEECLLPRLDKDQYSVYWVKHQDKKDPETQEPRLELNFIFACTELRQNKKLNVYYHYGDVARIDLWQSIQNYDYQLLDPKDPIRTKAVTIHKNHRIPDEYRYDKKCLQDFIESQIQAGNIVNRKTMIDVLKENDYVLSRQAKTSISIENPNGKNIKLTGDYYKIDFTAAQIVHTSKEEQSRLWHEQRKQDMPKMRERFEQLMAKRQQDLFNRHVKNNAGFSSKVDPDTHLEISIENEYSNRSFDDIQPSVYISEEEIAYQLALRKIENETQSEAKSSSNTQSKRTKAKRKRNTKLDPQLPQYVPNSSIIDSATSTQSSEGNGGDDSQTLSLNRANFIRNHAQKPPVAQIIYLETPTSQLVKRPIIRSQRKRYGKINFTLDRKTISDRVKGIFRRGADAISASVRNVNKQFFGKISEYYKQFAEFIGTKIGRNRKRRRKLNQGINIAYHSTKQLDNELTKRIVQTNLTSRLIEAGANQAKQATERTGAIIDRERQYNTRLRTTGHDFKSKTDEFKSKVNDPRFIEKTKDRVRILQENQSLSQAIAKHYEDMCRNGLITHTGIEQFPLFKAYKALIDLQFIHYPIDDTQNTSQKIKQGTKQALLDYKQAMFGIRETDNLNVIQQRLDNHSIGLLEWLDYQKTQRDSSNLPTSFNEHIQQTKILAKTLNVAMKTAFEQFGGTKNDYTESYYLGRKEMYIDDMFVFIDRNLGVRLPVMVKPITPNLAQVTAFTEKELTVDLPQNTTKTFRPKP